MVVPPVLAAQELWGSHKDGGKAERVVVTVREAGVATLRPGGAVIGFQVEPPMPEGESIRVFKDD